MLFIWFHRTILLSKSIMNLLLKTHSRRGTFMCTTITWCLRRGGNTVISKN